MLALLLLLVLARMVLLMDPLLVPLLDLLLLLKQLLLPPALAFAYAPGPHPPQRIVIYLNNLFRGTGGAG
jgi:hypothetical protein